MGMPENAQIKCFFRRTSGICKPVITGPLPLVLSIGWNENAWRLNAQKSLKCTSKTLVYVYKKAQISIKVTLFRCDCSLIGFIIAPYCVFGQFLIQELSDIRWPMTCSNNSSHNSILTSSFQSMALCPLQCGFQSDGWQLVRLPVWHLEYDLNVKQC